jgi:HEAT repeat protein
MNENDRAETIKNVRALVLQGDPAKREEFEKRLAIARPVLDELGELGYHVATLDDLKHEGKPWKRALPVLSRWLPRIDHPDVKESIVRCLSVPWIGNQATAQFIEEFKKAAPSSSLAWAIGNALSIVDVTGFEKQIAELCRNRKYGTARQMLVLGLGRFRDLETEETALNLLNDEEVKLHAIGALGAMRSKRALPELEKLLTDKKTVIRKEARKAITKITR